MRSAHAGNQPRYTCQAGKVRLLCKLAVLCKWSQECASFVVQHKTGQSKTDMAPKVGTLCRWQLAPALAAPNPVCGAWGILPYDAVVS